MMRAESSPAERGIRSWSIRRTDLALVALATALVAALSLLLLGARSLWIDEGISFYFAADGASPWQRLAHREANMWLYYFLLHVWLGLGDSEAVIRSLSVLCATATIPLVYILGRRLFGSWAGAWAALLLATNAFFVRYAQEARGYALMVFFVTLASYFLVRAVQEDSRRSWVGHGVALGLAVLTHFFAALVYVPHILAAALLGPRALPWKGLTLSTAALGVGLLPILLWQPLGADQLAWVEPLTWPILTRFFAQIAGGSRASLLLYLLLWAVALLAVAPRHGPAASARWSHLFVVAWLAVPVGIAAGFSAFIQPVFLDRYLLGTLPAAALLAGAGLARLQPRWLGVPVLLLLLGASARSLNHEYRGPPTEDWRSATAYVLSQARADDAAVFYVTPGKFSFDYYAGRLPGVAGPTTVDLRRLTKVGHRLESQVAFDRLSSLPTQYDRVWLLLCHEEAFPGSPDKLRILEHLDRSYVLQAQQEFPGVKVRLYQRAGPGEGGVSFRGGQRYEAFGGRAHL